MRDNKYAYLVIPNFRLGIRGECIYCGDYLDMVEDHVIPYSYFSSGKRFSSLTRKKQGLTVVSCSDCNRRLHSFMFDSFDERYQYIRNVITRTNTNIYRRSVWDAIDIEKLDHTLKTFVKGQRVLQESAVSRVEWDQSEKMIRYAFNVRKQIEEINHPMVSDFFESWIKKYA